MNLRDLSLKVRVHARDFNHTIFRQSDITMFLNEGIDRFAQVFPELLEIPYFAFETDVVQIIPKKYAHLLANYAVSRLFAQDERQYEATTQMNEFEIKLNELKSQVESGEVVFLDSAGVAISNSTAFDYVTDVYFSSIPTEEV